jgi:hypothetical protein
MYLGTTRNHFFEFRVEPPWRGAAAWHSGPPPEQTIVGSNPARVYVRFLGLYTRHAVVET